MSNIEHILYDTIGADFEKYLQPKDIFTLSNVSKATREGNLTRRFRELYIATMKEYEIFKKNNEVESKNEAESDVKTAKSINNFLKYIPLGVIYKNYKLEQETDINTLLDYIGAGLETRLYIWLELCTLSDFEEYLVKINNDVWNKINTSNYYNPYEDNRNEENYLRSTMDDIIVQASIRNRPDIVKATYIEYIKHWNVEHYQHEEYYSSTPQLRDLFINYRPDIIYDLMNRRVIRNFEEYAISYDPNDVKYDENLDREFGSRDDILNSRETSTFLRIFLFYATSFQEQDTFKQLYLSYHYDISDTIQRILDDKSLKYNIDIYNEKLFINNDL